MSNIKKKETNARLVGAALGAAVGVGIGAAAVALSNKDNRKAVADKTNQLKKQAEQAVTNGKAEAAKVEKKFHNHLDEMMDRKDEAVKQVDSASKPAAKKIAAAKKA